MWSKVAVALGVLFLSARNIFMLHISVARKSASRQISPFLHFKCLSQQRVLCSIIPYTVRIMEGRNAVCSLLGIIAEVPRKILSLITRSSCNVRFSTDTSVFWETNDDVHVMKQTINI